MARAEPDRALLPLDDDRRASGSKRSVGNTLVSSYVDTFEIAHNIEPLNYDHPAPAIEPPGFYRPPPLDYEPIGPLTPDGWHNLDGVERGRPSPFHLQPWSDIGMSDDGEWLVKKLIPAQGVVAIYGKPGSFKSFVALDLAAHVAAGEAWAGRKTKRGQVVYIAAEGAAGLRKRKAGLARHHPDWSPRLPLFLISAAPSLGAGIEDTNALIASIEEQGVKPVQITIDTLQQSLGGADENSAGMTTFVTNAQRLARHFGCVVVVVHHVGHGDDNRMRGHSSLAGAVDVQLLVERHGAETIATLTPQKVKDETSDFGMTATLLRVVVGCDADGEEVTTLVVDAIGGAEPKEPSEQTKPVPRSQKLLMNVIAGAIRASGETLDDQNSGSPIRAVSEAIVREAYYAMIAEEADPNEEGGAIKERQRKGFNRAIKGALKAKTLGATDRDGKCFLWIN